MLAGAEHAPPTHAPMSVNSASNASRMAVSIAFLGFASTGFLTVSVSILSGVQLGRRLSRTLKQSATWKVQAWSLAAPKSQLGSSSVQRSSRRGRPLESSSGAG